jgi:hypothetical protein
LMMRAAHDRTTERRKPIDEQDTAEPTEVMRSRARSGGGRGQRARASDAPDRATRIDVLRTRGGGLCRRAASPPTSIQHPRARLPGLPGDGPVGSSETGRPTGGGSAGAEGAAGRRGDPALRARQAPACPASEMVGRDALSEKVGLSGALQRPGEPANQHSAGLPPVGVRRRSARPSR